ncbi:MAG: helix-turn-helix domain-containing protein [Armatimonadota bacterium]
MAERLLTLTEVAERTGISETFWRSEVGRGRIPACRVGQVVYLRPSEVRAAVRGLHVGIVAGALVKLYFSQAGQWSALSN